MDVVAPPWLLRVISEKLQTQLLKSFYPPGQENKSLDITYHPDHFHFLTLKAWVSATPPHPNPSTKTTKLTYPNYVKMSRHQAVRNLDYEEALDEFEGDDYEEEGEADQLSAEDREAMAIGTATVQSTLGPDADKVTVQQIQESLWHYYYDIEKTVSYLQKKFIAPPPAPKQEKKAKDGFPERWRQYQKLSVSAADGFGCGGMDDKTTTYGMVSTSTYPVPRVAPLSPASYFHGISWMNVPKSRQAVFVPPRPVPGGLLGGGDGPKLSKLQALAAARKKKTTEVNKTDDKVDRAEKRMSTLAIDESSKENQRGGLSILAKRQKLAEDPAARTQISKSATPSQQADAASEAVSMDVDTANELSAEDRKKTEDDCFVVPSTRPSAFAQTLFGPAQDTAAASQTYSLPYMDSSAYVPSAFSQPSPDDVVLAAQAKAGSKFDAAAKSASKKVVAKSSGSQTPNSEMKQLQLDDSAAPKNKKLDVVKEFAKSENKRSASFVVVGNGFILKNVTFVPISGLSGANLVEKPADEGLSWYTGPTLIEALEDSDPMARAIEKPFRMSISEIYRSQQSQLTVAGRIESGTVQNGEALIVQPSGESASIRSIEVDADAQEWAVAGQNVNIGLYGIDPIHVRVGDIISTKAAPIETSDRLTMKVLAFDHLMPMPVDVHRGRLHAAGRVEVIPAVLDKLTGATVKKNPRIVQPGKVARVVVKLDSKVPLEAGQRVVLRSGGETIAAGLLE
ncbi:elongation factor Tu GTP binding domain-containing protein [Colletotrichum cuscutae]|uniref:Elongation factor Tu GTP binding domain-containing protein n=1 Tax=Colletotrichum cuscutae TaxID=1209917 RepID=A0AAI9XI29_9PEZI|nr:elongation factor Tu GTP binding domain-containing protein [Colletotrichum cuscutae]